MEERAASMHSRKRSRAEVDDVDLGKLSRRPGGGGQDGKAAKRKQPRLSKKQQRMFEYHSSSSDDDEEGEGDDGGFAPVDLADSDAGSSDELDDDEAADDGASSSDDEGSESDSFSSSASSSENDRGSHALATAKKPKTHRHDPAHFSATLARLLANKTPGSGKSSSGANVDPVLARSAEAAASSREAAEAGLDAAARRKLRAEKKEKLEKGRIRDVLVPSHANAVAGKEGQDETTVAQLIATETRLRKTAQRGVVKLFNAVRQAQERAAAVQRASAGVDGLSAGLVGRTRKEENAIELSRDAFLGMINSGQPGTTGKGGKDGKAGKTKIRMLEEA